MANEAIIEVNLSFLYRTIRIVSFTYIDESIMIITKGQAVEVAVQVKDHISINIHEVVTLALLGIDESLDLKRGHEFILMCYLPDKLDQCYKTGRSPWPPAV